MKVLEEMNKAMASSDCAVKALVGYTRREQTTNEILKPKPRALQVI